MKAKWFACAVFLFLFGFAFSSVLADDDDRDDGHQFPKNATFTTLITTPRAIEGLTGDHSRNLYTGGAAIVALGDTFCPVWRINLSSPSLVVVGKLPTPCSPLGIAFNDIGDLFVADGANAKIWKFTPNAGTPPTAITFATGVPGANGVAFDRDGNLWTSDGVTGQGRVWKITGPGANCTLNAEINCTEVFRIQPMAATNVEIGLSFGSGAIFGNGVTAVGRDVRDLPPGTIDANRADNNTVAGTSQPLVANGLAFNHKGDLFIIDTAHGALWKVEFDRHGNLKSPTGCDPVFKANTLCLSNIFVAHPILEGGDGIALDRGENIWVDANERNAVAVVTKEDGKVIEIFRNPVNTNTKLRNEATDPAKNNRILEFPTSPFLSGKVFCTANSDLNRRDNFPRAAGEIDGGNTTGTGKPLGKISCMDQELKIPGLPLPVH